MEIKIFGEEPNNETKETLEIEKDPDSFNNDVFEIVPIKRGFLEIKNLYDAIYHLDVFICGGYVRYMASPNRNPVPAGDVDIFCKDEENYYKIKEILENKIGLKTKHENDISITFVISSDEEYKYCPPVQLIKPVNDGAIVATGSLEKVLENFDFSVIRCGLLTPPDKALVDGNFLYDEKNMSLRIKNIHCPISSLMRCMKYAKKGYYLRPIEALKLFRDWEERDDEYRDKIEEYLIKANNGKGLTQKDIDELEALMRID